MAVRELDAQLRLVLAAHPEWVAATKELVEENAFQAEMRAYHAKVAMWENLPRCQCQKFVYARDGGRRCYTCGYKNPRMSPDQLVCMAQPTRRDRFNWHGLLNKL